MENPINANMNASNNNISMNLLGVYSNNPDLLKERNEVLKYYYFYGGKAATPEDALHELTQGQSWIIPTDLDYVPSQDIRNHTKKLLQKQRRFMFGAKPDILFKPLDKKDKDNAEQKRMILDKILDDEDFWGKTSRAFLDCTIGKRVLLTVQANPDEEIVFKYYTMTEFTYEVDPNDYTKVNQVIIAYMDAETANKPLGEQLWHRWKYYMGENGHCFIESGVYNGFAEPIGEVENKDTLLDELPCRVIINGGLTGDIDGDSDVKELMDMQNAYNHVSSDYRDALRFRMFEQPVFTNADSNSLKNIKIAPNAIIDLQTDPAIEDGKSADAKMLSSSFSFKEPADSYLDRLKSDMYEIMDQPRPEDLRNVPSAKALRFMFYDLIARCEEKWLDWEPAIKWMVRFVAKCINQFNLYPDLQAKQYINTATNMVINHNYPIPEDEEAKKELAIKEVQGNVRSHKSYIRDYSDIEDEDGEWNEILTEQTDINNATQDQFQIGNNLDQQNLNGGKGNEGNVGGGTAGKGGSNPAEEGNDEGGNK